MHRAFDPRPARQAANSKRVEIFKLCFQMLVDKQKSFQRSMGVAFARSNYFLNRHFNRFRCHA